MLLKYHESEIANMKTSKLASKPFVLLRGVLLMTTQVNSSFLRTEKLLSKLKCDESALVNMKSHYSSFLRTDDKINTASFLRCRGVL